MTTQQTHMRFPKNRVQSETSGPYRRLIDGWWYSACSLYSRGRWGWAISALIDCKWELLGLRLQRPLSEGRVRGINECLNLLEPMTDNVVFFGLKLQAVKRNIINWKDNLHVHRPVITYSVLYSPGLKNLDQFRTLKDCLVIYFFSLLKAWELLPWNCAQHIKSIPCAHIHTSSNKLLADSQCVGTAEWVRPQMQENTKYKRPIYHSSTCW